MRTRFGCAELREEAEEGGVASLRRASLPRARGRACEEAEAEGPDGERTER